LAPRLSEPTGGVPVRAEDLRIRAGDRLLLDGADARFRPGQVTLIVGPSGAGKSTLLRLLAGLLGEADAGIEATGRVSMDGKITSPANRRRRVGVVFQSHALFDELSPMGNVRLAKSHRRRRGPSAAHADSPQQLLRELGVPLDVRTSALSGGQRQRLAIARTMAYDPDVVLYDEPTAGLDAATANEVAALIRATHANHPKTSIVVTHDYEALAPIADRIYFLDAEAKTLREIDHDQWSQLRECLRPISADRGDEPSSGPLQSVATAMRRTGGRAADFLSSTTRVVEAMLMTAVSLLPGWRSPIWGIRFLAHYLRLVAGPSAWAYLAVSGMIAGFVTTYFTFRFLPYARYTEPLLIEDLLSSMGFALYRILVPVLATILIAARCGAAVASDVGGKSYGRQLDAMRTMGIRPRFYLLTPILYSFLIGVPVLTWISYQAASLTSLVVFTATHPERGPDFWHLHYHWRLAMADQALYQGTWWLVSKLLLCASGIGLIAYYRGARPKYSNRDISNSITSTILWSTLLVLIVHFAFAFFEF
jgi:ABC-type multidrug transport system ATPase subunit/ABC-type transporter Mla maintaining outer membrane lipid asymmetry permease subunit MlaE